MCDKSCTKGKTAKFENLRDAEWLSFIALREIVSLCTHTHLYQFFFSIVIGIVAKSSQEKETGRLGSITLLVAGVQEL